jgi:putative membrane protein
MIVTGRLRPWSPYLGSHLLTLLALDSAVAVAYVFGGWKWLALPDVPLSIFGGVIGVIAGFRNASAYARWWEARTIWGAIVNSSRNFAREVLTMLTAPDGEPESQCEIRKVQRNLIVRQIAYVHALRHHLRGTLPWAELEAFIPSEEIESLRAQRNVPLAIHQSIGCLVSQCRRNGWIDDIRWSALDRTLGALLDSQGAAERIKNTPMPRLYELYIRVTINVFCVLLPLGMVARLGLWTPLGSTLVGIMFLALDGVGRQIEAPFENRPPDIPLTAITRTIEVNLKQMLGEKDAPELLAPIDGILW